MFGRQLETEIKESESINALLNFIGNEAQKMITEDICDMIEKNMYRQLDGYVLSLSRIMKHETAWNCIIKAFANKNEPIPPCYYQQFGKVLESAT